MADRFGGSNALIAMALGAILAVLVIFLFFGGSGIFGADDPADVEVQIAPDAPEVTAE